MKEYILKESVDEVRFKIFDSVKIEGNLAPLIIVRDKETGVSYFTVSNNRITCPVYDENGQVKIVK